MSGFSNGVGSDNEGEVTVSHSYYIAQQKLYHWISMPHNFSKTAKWFLNDVPFYATKILNSVLTWSQSSIL